MTKEIQYQLKKDPPQLKQVGVCYNWLNINYEGGILFFEVDWIEDEAGFSKRVFRAKDLDTMYRAIKHMNIERQGMRRLAMKKIRIQALANYDKKCSDITENFNYDITSMRIS